MRRSDSSPLPLTGIPWIGLLFLIVAMPVQAAVDYDFVYVDAFQTEYALREAYVFDLNNQGEGCGWATDLQSYSGFWWSQAAGKVRLPWSYVRGINDVGQIAGWDQVFDRSSQTAVTIPIVSGAAARPNALDINDLGVVVGYDETCVCSNSQRVLQIPYVWDATRGARSISVPGAKELVKVNNHNVAVGNIRGGPVDGFVHDLESGRTTLLGAFFPPTNYPWTEATAINDFGVVTGIHRAADASTYEGYVWTESQGATLLPHLGGRANLDVRPSGINDAGVVVGRAEAADNEWRAFVWDAAHGIRDLNSLTTLPANFILDRALTINDRGWIAGDGHFGPNWSSSQAFVLIPRAETLVGVPPFQPSRVDLRLSPNPAGGPITLEFGLERAGAAKITVFDLRGRRIATVLEEVIATGRTVRWDGRDSRGQVVPSGTYLVRLESVGQTITRSLVIVR